MPKTESVSVALCTYNGVGFLAEQIESIINQTYTIDELIVCDDNSTDSSVDLVRALTQNQAFVTKIYVNHTNVGSTQNFANALELCTNDIVFFADQDDRWTNTKVEKMVHFFAKNSQKNAVFTNADIINHASETTGQNLWESVGFDKQQQAHWQAGEAYKILFQGFVVTGATLAVRKSAMSALMPFPQIHKNLIHDGWIALALSLTNQIGFIPERLISYRIHQSQQVGIGKKQQRISILERFSRNRKEKIAPLLEKTNYFEALYTLLTTKSFINSTQLQYLENIKNHFQVRTNLPQQRLKRVPAVFAEWRMGRYKYSSKSWLRPLLGDLFE